MQPYLAAFTYYEQLSVEHHQRRYEPGYAIGLFDGTEPETVKVSRLELELLAARGHVGALGVLYDEAVVEDDARTHFQTTYKGYKPPDFRFKMR